MDGLCFGCISNDMYWVSAAEPSSLRGPLSGVFDRAYLSFVSFLSVAARVHFCLFFHEGGNCSEFHYNHGLALIELSRAQVP